MMTGRRRTTMPKHARRLATALLLLAGVWGFPVAAQTTLTMSSWVPPTHGMTLAMRAWGEELERATQGRLKFVMLPKPPTAPPGTFDAVRDDLVDISFVTASYTPARHLLTKLPELPGGGTTAEINSVAYWRIHERYFQKAGEYKGVKLLTVFTHGPGQVFNTRKPINVVEDLQGMKIRTGGGIAEELARALGASPFVKPAPESYELLSAGVADATFFPLESVASFKLDKVIRYTTIFPGGLYSTAMAFFMNAEKFEKLPKQDQDAILAFSGERLARFVGRYWDASDRQGMEVLRKSGGQVQEASAPLIKGVQQRASVIEQEWVKAANAKGVDGARALADFREEVRRVTAGQ
jgi:TRAP-type transport system periplasmic protein